MSVKFTFLVVFFSASTSSI